MLLSEAVSGVWEDATARRADGAGQLTTSSIRLDSVRVALPGFTTVNASVTRGPLLPLSIWFRVVKPPIRTWPVFNSFTSKKSKPLLSVPRTYCPAYCNTR